MKTITILTTITAFIMLFVSASESKATDRKPVLVQAWGGALSRISFIVDEKDSANLPEFVFGNDQDINVEEIEALKYVNVSVLPEVIVSNPDDIDAIQIEALKEIHVSVLPPFKLNGPEDIDLKDIEVLKLK